MSFTISLGETGDLAVVLLSSSGLDGFLFGDRRVPLTFDACTLLGIRSWMFFSATVDATVALRPRPCSRFP
ncbi:MAG: hypothetical protein U1E76_24520 [Planctomycetota bacterium]